MDFIEEYIAYRQQTEPPYNCHRWCAISALAAAVGRKAYFPFGDQRIFPNLYVMAIGEPAARKSTAIKQMRGLLADSGYQTFSADKTRQEKFLMDLAGITEEGQGYDRTQGRKRSQAGDQTTYENLWGAGEETSKTGDPAEVYIASDEFSDFTPPGSGEFYTLLGNLWDYDAPGTPFTHRLKNSASLEIYQPTINILGGITPELFSKTFPPEIIGTGFLSRLIMIHVERSARKFTIPPRGDAACKERLVDYLKTISDLQLGELNYTDEAYTLLDRIYNGWEQLDDPRFKSYSSRRFTQLLKLCLVTAVSKEKDCIDEEIIVYANTVLTAAEQKMPQALGEFGKNKYSGVQNVIMELLLDAKKPYSLQEMWKLVVNDLSSTRELAEILSNLELAGKVQRAGGGFLLNKKVRKKADYVEWSLLTLEERGVS